MTRMKHYDLIVIGAGVGLTIAQTGVRLGWKVALIESGPLGGTCLNRGCIPSKRLIHAADVLTEIEHAAQLGITADIKDINFKKIIQDTNQAIDQEATEIETAIQKNPKIDLYKTTAYFKENKIIIADNEELAAKRIVIAAGTRPIIPNIPGIETINYLTSTEALRLEDRPESMIIIGGGYIATELGHFFGTLGTKVTIIEQSKNLVMAEDSDIAQSFTRLFSKKHTVKLNTKIISVAKNQDDSVNVQVKYKDNSTEIISADKLLLAVGRQPNTDTLKLKNTDITLDTRGYIVTNDFLETNIPGIWSLGDIIGKAPFRHGANWEATHLKNYLAGDTSLAVDYSIMPHAIFSSPQVAGVGLTEEQVKKQGIAYVIAQKPYSITALGQAMHTTPDHFVKYILDPKQEIILGCHIIGPQASILIHEVIVAMRAGGKVSLLRDSIHIHPALSEVVQRTLL